MHREHLRSENPQHCLSSTSRIRTCSFSPSRYFIIVNDLREDVNALSLILLADLYQLNTLFDACSARILQNLKVDNYVESARIFHRFEIKDGYDKLVDFGKNCYRQIQKLESYDSLPFAFRYGVIEHTVQRPRIRRC